LPWCAATRWKPSEKTPLTALAVHALFLRAAAKFGDAPEGLATLLIGGREIGEALVDDPRCYLPAYLAPSGWIGIDLSDDTDWNEIAELLDASYRRTAGRRRVARLDAATG
jgi:hypothetical protein